MGWVFFAAENDDCKQSENMTMELEFLQKQRKLVTNSKISRKSGTSVL